jgi:hypothetical protein
MHREAAPLDRSKIARRSSPIAAMFRDGKHSRDVENMHVVK